jgi:cation transport ATPase
MPKTRPKTTPKETKPKMKSKLQPKPVSITSSKTYWITLALMMVVFGSVYGYITKVAVVAIGLLLATVLVLIGFAFYLKFKQSTQNNRIRATFIFSGASIIGFLIWVAVVLVLDATGSWVQIEASMSDNFFAVTSLIICLTSGAIIGDILFENKEKISLFLQNKFSR